MSSLRTVRCPESSHSLALWIMCFAEFLACSRHSVSICQMNTWISWKIQKPSGGTPCISHHKMYKTLYHPYFFFPFVCECTCVSLFSLKVITQYREFHHFLLPAVTCSIDYTFLSFVFTHSFTPGSFWLNFIFTCDSPIFIK